MNIGIFGGSFNPPHIGHQIVVESIRDQVHLGKILLVPSAQSPTKQDRSLAPPADRLAMTRLAFADYPEYEVSDIEVKRRGLSYTIDTLQQLAALFPRAQFSLIIGADNLLEFAAWRAPEEILARADLIVMSRPGYELPPGASAYAHHARIVNVPQIGISSTDIRRRIKLGRSIRYLVPRAVEEYIAAKRLYRE